MRWLSLYAYCAFFLSASANEVNWYLRAGDIGGNAQLIAEHGSALSGVYLCCGLMNFAANGTFSMPYSIPETAAQIDVVTAANRTVWMVGSVDEAAVNTGSWSAGLLAVAAAGRVLAADGLDGLIIDYEPMDNFTQAHAAAFGAFLGALATALAPTGLRVGMDIAYWGILGKSFWPNYLGRGITRFTSMTPTYDGNNVSVNEAFVREALSALPSGSFAAGVASVLDPLVPPCPWLSNWTDATFPPFLEWLAAEGVSTVDVWKCDIDDYRNSTPAWMFDALAAFLAAGASSSP